VGILPTLPRLAALGFEGDLLGESSFKGAPFASAALEQGIHVADSGDRERPIHSIMNTGSGDHERLLARSCVGLGERPMLWRAIATDSCSVSFSLALRQAFSPAHSRAAAR